MDNIYSIENIHYDSLIWQTYKNSFYVLDENYCIRNKLMLKFFLIEDIMQFTNIKKKIIIDIGVYGENSLKLPFDGYTINVIELKNSDSSDWDNPLEVVKVNSSKEIKIIVEALLIKYR